MRIHPRNSQCPRALYGAHRCQNVRGDECTLAGKRAHAWLFNMKTWLSEHLIFWRRYRGQRWTSWLGVWVWRLWPVAVWIITVWHRHHWTPLRWLPVTIRAMVIILTIELVFLWGGQLSGRSHMTKKNFTLLARWKACQPGLSIASCNARWMASDVCLCVKYLKRPEKQC